MHPPRVTVWCAFWAGGIIGPFFFENAAGNALNVNGQRYRNMLIQPFTILIATPCIYGNTINVSDTVKYLGITLDKKLLFKEHVEQKTNKAIRALWICKSTFEKTWEISPEKRRNWAQRVLQKAEDSPTHGIKS
ncbi:hypothetical protein HUJ04_010922 [Dendroctonus ponderosae]|nr:hypothetical protein HUJ04_010922 [Dendroctonus ponderosae]